MKNRQLPLLVLLLLCGQLCAQPSSFPLPVEATEFTRLGNLGQSLFFSNQRPDDGSDQLWQFDTQTNQLQEWSTDSTYLVDFHVSPEGIFWLEKGLNNRFDVGPIELWFWSGITGEIPERLASNSAGSANLIDHSDTHLFLHFDDIISSLDLNTLQVQNLGSAPVPRQENQGIVWQGQYFWSVIENNQIYRADPETGVQLFWQAEARVYNFIPLGERLLWREGPRLTRYDWGQLAPEYYYEFEDWDLGISFFGEWFGASLQDSLYLFPGATKTHGSELWRTDGTAEGTYLLKDIATERTGNFVPSSFPRYLHQTAGKIHFMAYTKSTEPQQHWESDGTSEGTIQRSQRLGPDDRIYLGYSVNDSLYLLYLNSDLNGLEPVLFSDELTFYDLHTGPANSMGSIFPASWLGLNDGSLALEAFTTESGMEPWILNPDQSQVQLADIAPQKAWSTSTLLGEIDGLLYLIGGNVDQGYQIYPLDPKQDAEFPSIAPTLNWQQSITPAIRPSASVGWVYSLGLVRGTDGSIYSSGSTNVDATRLRVSQGEQPPLLQDFFSDAYVMRMDQQGNPEWRLPLPGSFIRSDAPFISETPEGGVYAGGRFFRSAQVGEIPIQIQAGDNYLAKIKADGTAQWAKTISLSGGEIFRLQTDTLGFLWTIGSFRNQAAIDGVFLSAGISPAYFVARWSPDGQLDWAISLEPGIDWPSFGPVHAAEIDPMGNFWVFLNNVGHNYNAPCDFGTIYGRLVKISPTGTVLAEREWSGDDAWYATDLSFTTQGNGVLVGRFRGNLQLGSISLRHSTSKCSSTGFVAKIDPLGNLIRAHSTEEERIPEAIVTNADGSYALAGYQELAEPTSYPGYTHFPFGRKQQRIFTAIYNSRDDLLVERNFLAQEEFDQGGFIYLLPGEEEEWILQGELEGMLDTIGAIHPSFGMRHHVQLLSFDLPYTLSEEAVDQNLMEDKIAVFPNPTTDYVTIQSEDLDFARAEIALYNSIGQRLGQTIQLFEPQVYRLNLANLPVGVYQLVVRLEDQILSKPIYKSE